MLELREDIDEVEVLMEAAQLVDYVIKKYNIQTFRSFSCPYMKGLAKELYWEEE